MIMPRLGTDDTAMIIAAKKGPNPVDKHVGSRVRMRRKMMNMSQVELADGLGITFQQVQKYENGSNRISASRLQEAARILQVPVPFFFEGAPEGVGQDRSTPLPAYVNEFVSSSDGLRLIKAFIRIHNAELQRRIVRLVRAIVGEDSGE
jgi:transcriptional regulator with XRE-family HTH domain